MHRGLISFLTKMAPNFFCCFLAKQVTFFIKLWGFSWELVGVFGSNVPLQLLIDPQTSLMFPSTGKIFPTNIKAHSAKIGQKSAKGVMPILRVCVDVLEGRFFQHSIVIEVSWGPAKKIIKI